MNQTGNLENFKGLWCVFPAADRINDALTRLLARNKETFDALEIHSVEEIGVRYGAVPYIRFRPENDKGRVIELLGAWCISNIK
jgi:hypothetical protein